MLSLIHILILTPEGDEVKLFELVYFRKHAPKEVPVSYTHLDVYKRQGMVTADDDNAYFRCLSCGHQETRDRTIYRYDVHNQCKNCGRYYRCLLYTSRCV